MYCLKHWLSIPFNISSSNSSSLLIVTCITRVCKSNYVSVCDVLIKSVPEALKIRKL